MPSRNGWRDAERASAGYLAPNASGAVESGSSANANARKEARGAPFADARVCSSHSPHNTRRVVGQADCGSDHGEKERRRWMMNGKRVSFRRTSKKKETAFVFDVWRTSVVRSGSGFDSRVATHEIARSTDPPVGRIGLNVNVRQDRQDGFPVRRARATPHAPFRRRCDSVRIATNARVCARRDSPCGPARGSRGAGQRDAGNEKRKSTSRLTPRRC